MSAVERIDPPNSAPELEMLTAWLDYHRATLLLKCDGLSPGQLCQRSVQPSTMTLIGLVRHMAEVERHWFCRHYLGRDAPPLYYDESSPDGDFENVDPATVEADLARFDEACAESRRIVAGFPDLERVGVRPGDHRDGMPLRWILVHMIEEYARHNGHADFLRERIDGVTGD